MKRLLWVLLGATAMWLAWVLYLMAEKWHYESRWTEPYRRYRHGEITRAEWAAVEFPERRRGRPSYADSVAGLPEPWTDIYDEIAAGPAD